MFSIVIETPKPRGMELVNEVMLPDEVELSPTDFEAKEGLSSSFPRYSAIMEFAPDGIVNVQLLLLQDWS